MNDEFESTQSVLERRLLEKKAEFIKNHTLLSLPEFADKLRIKGKKRSRSIYRLRKEKKVLAIKIDDEYFYPDFQLNNAGSVYSALEIAMPRFPKILNGWDIAFWLTSSQTIVQYISVLDLDVVKEIALNLDSLDEIAEFIVDKIDTSGVRTEMPLGLLENGEVQLFAEFVAWYLCDEPEITLKVV
ncbi:hypothetical protein [Aliivibrio fischeri]|uniref:hypothetical protein n=1 Tax=Aliivibrio fischeri TaxID=668 RepID=UPI00080EA05D|nr:hypothetical protein [Aliivibrio fischeri]OCH39199.1 hypothetical protein A6D99_09075 [Aliivibrio fischeri]